MGENYEPLPAGIAEGGELAIHSKVLGLDIRLEKGGLRFYDPATGRKLLSYQEVEQARQEAEQRLQQEATARQALEAWLAELETQLQRQEGEGAS